MTRLEEIIWDIRACLEGLTIQSKLYGEGLITQITGNNPNLDNYSRIRNK